MEQTIEDRLLTVAKNIRKAREFRNYTQEYLAMKLGVSQNAYSKIELGYTRITLVRLLEVSQILEIETSDLIWSNKIEMVLIKS